MSVAEARHPAQRRILAVLSIGQALGGIANGVALGVGSLLVAQVTGEESLAGLAATLLTLGGAILAVPLAALARRRGRRVALTTGAVGAAVGSATLMVGGTIGSTPIVLGGFLLLGAAMTVNLQSRFAATDLAEPAHRGRDLSLVVWMTTIGVVVGPNLIPAGDMLGGALGMPHLVGAYVIAGASQLLIAFVLFVGLRPDPLLEARSSVSDQPRMRLRLREHPAAARAIVIVACAHATMVGVMALTPVHLDHAGHGLAIIGLTMSAHTAGMYALSPVFGMLSDRWGRSAVILLGEGVFAAAVLVSLLLGDAAAPVALALLGLGWSAVTVAGSTLVADAVEPGLRTAVQGRADLVLGLSGAAAGAAAGPILSVAGYGGLNVAMLAFVVIGTLAVLRSRGTARVQTMSSNSTPPPPTLADVHERHRKDPQ